MVNRKTGRQKDLSEFSFQPKRQKSGGEVFIYRQIDYMFKHVGALYKEASLGSPWLTCQSTLQSAGQIQYGGRVEDKKG